MDITSLINEIDAKIAQLQTARNAIVGLASAPAKRRRGRPPGSVKATVALEPTRKKRTMSPAGRKRVAEAQRKRWAAQKKKA
jgi:hypothetical protein